MYYDVRKDTHVGRREEEEEEEEEEKVSSGLTSRVYERSDKTTKLAPGDDVSLCSPDYPSRTLSELQLSSSSTSHLALSFSLYLSLQRNFQLTPRRSRLKPPVKQQSVITVRVQRVTQWHYGKSSFMQLMTP